jgi:hypothetical protein
MLCTHDEPSSGEVEYRSPGWPGSPTDQTPWASTAYVPAPSIPAPGRRHNRRPLRHARIGNERVPAPRGRSLRRRQAQKPRLPPPVTEEGSPTTRIAAAFAALGEPGAHFGTVARAPCCARVAARRARIATGARLAAPAPPAEGSAEPSVSTTTPSGRGRLPSVASSPDMHAPRPPPTSWISRRWSSLVGSPRDPLTVHSTLPRGAVRAFTPRARSAFFEVSL